MFTTARNWVLLFITVLMIAGAGCTSPQSPTSTMNTDNPQTSVAGEAAAKRFQNTSLGGRTAVESAIELSQKYASLSDQTVTLREENQRLKTENENLQQQIVSLETRLKQTQKELNEANDLLIEMLSELNTWKANILGFRGEMRDAAKAQLEAMLKVLEILGGKVEADALVQNHTSVLKPESSDAPEPNGPTTPLPEDANNAE